MESIHQSFHPPIHRSKSHLLLCVFFCPCLPHLRQRQLQLRELLLQRHEGGRRRAAQRRLRLALITTLPLIPLLLGRLLAAPPALLLEEDEAAAAASVASALTKGANEYRVYCCSKANSACALASGVTGPPPSPSRTPGPREMTWSCAPSAALSSSGPSTRLMKARPVPPGPRPPPTLRDSWESATVAWALPPLWLLLLLLEPCSKSRRRS